jgi:hypothetical protein
MKTLTLLTALSLSSVLFSAEKEDDKPFYSLDNRFYAGPLVQHTTLHAKGLGTFKGTAGGVQIGYQRIRPDSLFARAYAIGDWTTLDGSGFSKITQNKYTLGGHLGFSGVFGEKDRFTIAPYTGCAYHYLDEKREIQGYSSYHAAYKLPFVPLGLLFLAQVNPLVSIGIDYQYQFDIDPMVKLSYMNGALWKLKREDNQYVEMIFAFRWANHWDVRLTPYYRYLKTGASTAVTTIGTQLGIQKQSYQTFGGSLAVSYFF